MVGWVSESVRVALRRRLLTGGPHLTVGPISADGESRQSGDAMDALLKLGPWAIALIFQTGILYAGILAMRRDLKGVGTKVRNIQEANEQRYITIVAIQLLNGVPKEDFERYHAYAKLLIDSAKGRNL